jgi:hypothetical protein
VIKAAKLEVKEEEPEEEAEEENHERNNGTTSRMVTGADAARQLLNAVREAAKASKKLLGAHVSAQGSTLRSQWIFNIDVHRRSTQCDHECPGNWMPSVRPLRPKSTPLGVAAHDRGGGQAVGANIGGWQKQKCKFPSLNNCGHDFMPKMLLLNKIDEYKLFGSGHRIPAGQDCPPRLLSDQRRLARPKKAGNEPEGNAGRVPAL